MFALRAEETERRKIVSAGVGNKGQSMAMMMKRRVAFGLGIMLSLTACEGQDPLSIFKPAAEDTPSAETGSREAGETRDVEAPEIFSEAEAGLWDGRPSLGGVWVAYPDVPDPERVLIRNTENGNTVVGALFRRERDNPGPRFQISSDAADALNILAGAPTQIDVVALKREVVSAPPSADTAETNASEMVDPAVIATAAIEAAELESSGAVPVPPAAASLPAPAPVETSSLSRPYIQIGIFSVESNARATAAQMQGAGLAAETLAQESQGKAFYRVVVGPAQTESARAAALETVKSLGFSDAYFVTN